MPGMSDLPVARHIPPPDPVEERLTERLVDSTIVHRGHYL